MNLRILMLFFSILIIPFTANAAESIKDFEIKVMPAEGQHDFSQGYFHVDSEPGSDLSFDFQITNTSSEPLRLNAQAVDAYTADKGGILYGADEAGKEQNRIYMSKLIDVQETITIAPGMEETVHIHLTVPADASGTILGGIMLQSENAPDGQSMATLNKGGSNYTFEQPGKRLVAIKLDLPEKSASGFTLGKAEFQADENNIKLNIHNGKPSVLENVQGTYTVMDKEGEIVVNGVLKPFAMAPLSEINFPIDLKGEIFEKGKYVLMIKGRADEKEFFAEEKFTVTSSSEAGIAIQTEVTSEPFSREKTGKTIAIVLVSLFLILPLLLKFGGKNNKRTFLDFTEKNHL